MGWCRRTVEHRPRVAGRARVWMRVAERCLRAAGGPTEMVGAMPSRAGRSGAAQGCQEREGIASTLAGARPATAGLSGSALWQDLTAQVRPCGLAVGRRAKAAVAGMGRAGSDTGVPSGTVVTAAGTRAGPGLDPGRLWSRSVSRSLLAERDCERDSPASEAGPDPLRGPAPTSACPGPVPREGTGSGTGPACAAGLSGFAVPLNLTAQLADPDSPAQRPDRFDEPACSILG
jgi:hypothetical protein